MKQIRKKTKRGDRRDLRVSSVPPPTLDEVGGRILELQRELAELQELRARLLKRDGLTR